MRTLVVPHFSAVFGGLGLTIFLAICSAWAGTETILHNFTGQSQGAEPMYALTPDGLGNFYGTTQTGGSNFSGDLFELSKDGSGGWQYNEIYEFSDSAIGCYPQGPLVFDENGNLYGAASGCGANSAGTIFELTRQSDGNWSIATIYSFGPEHTADGDHPNGVVYFKGNLYGTTFEGGTHGTGTVFMVAHNSDGSWSETVLHSCGYNAQQAQNPLGGVVLDQTGNLYGMTELGGPNQAGTVFKMSLNKMGTWEFRVIHSFNGNDGAMPWWAAPILDTKGNLYGTTVGGGSGGGGTVFELSPSGDSWTETVLHNFICCTDGYSPIAGLVTDSQGRLYGTTNEGGGRGPCTNPPSPQIVHCGTAFVLTPTKSGVWKETFLHRFADGADGGYPSAALVLDGEGNVYGVASGGGTGTLRNGVAFEFARLPDLR